MTETLLDAETAAALVLLRKRVLATSDPADLAGYLAQVGEFVLARLGFDMNEQADVQIHIGTDEHPDEAQIVLTWPLPPAANPAGPAA